MNSAPLISVCLITYNHEKYVRQALEGIFMQKTDFPMEVIIADDCSKDNTRKIILEFKDKYPEIIKLIFQDKNVGAAKNWEDLIGSPIGKYVAYLEGDDYWSDSLKLQKQVDFLENNPEYVGCFHNVEVRYDEDMEKASTLLNNFSSAKNHTFEEITFRNQMGSCSVVYRNNAIQEYPDFLYKAQLGDWLLHLIHSQFGDFYYLPHAMGVYRLHNNSTWALQDHQKNLKKIQDAYHIMIDSKYFSEENTKLLEIGLQHFLKTHYSEINTSKPSRKNIIQKGVGFMINKMKKFA